MILVIDIGNTFIKCGVFDSKDLIDRIAIQSVNELSSILKQYKLNKVIISSVVPEKSKDFINYINQKLNINQLILHSMMITHHRLLHCGTHTIDITMQMHGTLLLILLQVQQ